VTPLGQVALWSFLAIDIAGVLYLWWRERNKAR